MPTRSPLRSAERRARHATPSTRRGVYFQSYHAKTTERSTDIQHIPATANVNIPGGSSVEDLERMLLDTLPPNSTAPYHTIAPVDSAFVRLDARPIASFTPPNWATCVYWQAQGKNDVHMCTGTVAAWSEKKATIHAAGVFAQTMVDANIRIMYVDARQAVDGGRLRRCLRVGFESLACLLILGSKVVLFVAYLIAVAKTPTERFLCCLLLAVAVFI